LFGTIPQSIAIISTAHTAAFGKRLFKVISWLKVIYCFIIHTPVKFKNAPKSSEICRNCGILLHGGQRYLIILLWHKYRSLPYAFCIIRNGARADYHKNAVAVKHIRDIVTLRAALTDVDNRAAAFILLGMSNADKQSAPMHSP